MNFDSEKTNQGKIMKDGTMKQVGVIQVVATRHMEGTGEVGDPFREVSTFWSTAINGQRLAINDPYLAGLAEQRLREIKNARQAHEQAGKQQATNTSAPQAEQTDTKPA
jgi:hypothetical protein